MEFIDLLLARWTILLMDNITKQTNSMENLRNQIDLNSWTCNFTNLCSSNWKENERIEASDSRSVINKVSVGNSNFVKKNPHWLSQEQKHTFRQLFQKIKTNNIKQKSKNQANHRKCNRSKRLRERKGLVDPQIPIKMRNMRSILVQS